MLLDSNIIIYAGEPEYDYLRNFITDKNPQVSVISKIEVLGYHKFKPQTIEKIKKLFEVLPIIPITNEIVNQAIFLKQQQKISLGDSLVASTALIHNIELVTANTKDFKWIPDLKLINPIKNI